MKTVVPGGHLAVGVGEVFGLLRRGRETSGYRFSVDLPAGVERLAAERRPASGFGGRPEIVERFRCLRPGRFRIGLSEGRPWETPAGLGSVEVEAA